MMSDVRSSQWHPAGDESGCNFSTPSTPAKGEVETFCIRTYPNKGKSHYCVLCGQKTGMSDEGWCGHRSETPYSLCADHLCLLVYHGLKKS